MISLAKTYILRVIWSESFEKLSNVKEAKITVFLHLFYFHFAIFSPEVVKDHAKSTEFPAPVT
jgi:hypothetical protein